MPARPLLVAVACALTLAACTSGNGPASRTSAAPPSRTPSIEATTSSPTPTVSNAPKRTPHAAHLPLDDPTYRARQVITVVAGAQSDVRATVQAWKKVPGGWKRVGPSIPAWLGADGMSPQPDEQLSAVPMGSYTLTQAFGHDSDPGTALPYTHTTPSDWWISEPGPLYNTLQHCSADCAFAQGDPNEHLYYETPYYDYAAVIDYNRNPVRQGAGSAFFLHVSVNAPTQGCVAIDRDDLVRILRWLEPDEHPRILIGTD